MQKVLVLSFWFTEYCVQLVNALSDHLRVKLMLPDYIVGKQIDHLSKAVDLELFKKVTKRNPFNLVYSFSIARHIKQFRPDIVHIQCNGHAWFCFLLPFIRSGNRIVFTIHDPVSHIGEETFVRNIANRYVRHVGDRFIVHGRSLKDQMVTIHKMKQDRIDVVPMGTLSFYQVPENNSGDDKNTILFFGRIQDYKGIEYLIDAEPLIAKVVESFTIVIAGTGKSFQPYRERIRNPDRFLILNRYIEEGELTYLFKSASFVVLPYTEASQSGIIPMAYAYRKAVIATEVGGIPEVVDHRQTGLLIPPANTERLAKAIIWMLKNKEQVRQMGENAYQKLHQDLSWIMIAEKTVRVYERCIARH